MKNVFEKADEDIDPQEILLSECSSLFEWHFIQSDPKIFESFNAKNYGIKTI